MNTTEDLLAMRLSKQEQIIDAQKRVIENFERLESLQNKVVQNLRGRNFRYKLTMRLEALIIAVLSYLLVGCGGVVEGPAPTDSFEPRPHIPESPTSESRTKCEAIQQAPLLSCCFGSVCDLDCSPHESGLACYIEHAQECLFYETAELECYET